MNSHFPRDLRVSAFALGLALLGACEPAPDIPPLPDLELEYALPMVREQIETYVQRVETEPENANSNGHLGMVLQAHNKLRESAVLYDRAQILDPTSFAWPYYLGSALAVLGERQQAQEAFRRAIDLRPGNHDAQLALARLLLSDDDIAESRDLFEEVIQQSPERADAHFGYATLLDRIDELDRAIRHYQRALELNGPFGEGYQALGKVYLRAGDAAKSDEMFANYRKHQDTFLKSDDSLAAEINRLRIDDRRHVANAKRLAQKGRYDDAIAELDKGLQSNPHSADIHRWFVEFHSELEEWEKAESHYRQGMEIDPNWKRLHLSFGNMLFAQKRYEDAVKAFERALAIDPGFNLARVNLGVALEWHGEADRAADHYRQALASDPTLKRANHRLARYLAARGAYSEAIEHMERTLEPIDEQTPRTMRMLGQIHMLNKNLPKAIAMLERAKELATRMDDSQLAEMIDEDLWVLTQAHDAGRQ